MSEKDAHVLDYITLLQSRADEEQRQDLQEVTTSEKEEITAFKESLPDLAKTILNMENPQTFTLPPSRTTLISAAINPTSTPRAITAIVPKSLPLFAEGHNAIKDPTELLDKFNNVLVARQLATDTNWARQLPLCLAIQYADWVEHNIAATSSWEDAQGHFCKHFDDPLKKAHLHLDLLGISVQKGQTVQHFCDRLQRLMLGARVQDSDLSLNAHFLSNFNNM
ncbi:hypothetical protein K7432_015800 [Basidiobolus ranarum]|uniref:Retrotransposon gag domain-containing protein n=1 Tax=Basidiobolus ranarum TaxID=34480 RepID=A0ABR2VMQ2_9FUNG